MNLLRIDHLVITTASLEKCLNFYVGCLGMTHSVAANGQHAIHFGGCKINIHTYAGEFQPAASNPQVGCADFCLITDQNVEDLKKELTDKGVEIIVGVVEREGAQGMMHSIYMLDPDGNLVEIAQYI